MTTSGRGPVALPDVNLLIGWAWPNHPFHGVARAWFAAHQQSGWATCSVTALGFLRLSCTAAVVGEPLSPTDAGDVLAQLTAHGRHEQWDDVAPSTLDWSRARTRHDVTDAYLLGLAEQRRGRLVTFDRRLTRLAPNPSLVEVLSP